MLENVWVNHRDEAVLRKTLLKFKDFKYFVVSNQKVMRLVKQNEKNFDETKELTQNH